MDRLSFLLGQINKASYECRLDEKVTISVEDLILLKSEIEKLRKQITGKEEKIKDLQVRLNNVVAQRLKTYTDLQQL